MRRLLVLVGAIVLVDTMFFAALTPLLKHYVDELELGKAGAGVLQAMYPAGALVAGIPGGMAAARFLQGISSAFSWTGALSWLVAAAPPNRRGALIGSAFGAAIAGALFGPVLGAVASFTGTAPAFSAVAGLALVLAVAAWRTPAASPTAPQPLRMLFRALKLRRVQIPIWLCLLPALLFGNLSVLAPLRLSHLGWGAAAIGATYLVMAALEATWAPFLGRASDRYGRLPPLRAALVASAIVAFLLPWPGSPWLLALVITAAGLAFGSFWTPAMSWVTDEAEAFGLDYGYAFALVNVAWAPGQAGGSALGGAIASVTSDAVPYLALSALCLLSLLTVRRSVAVTAPSPDRRSAVEPGRS